METRGEESRDKINPRNPRGKQKTGREKRVVSLYCVPAFRIDRRHRVFPDTIPVVDFPKGHKPLAFKRITALLERHDGHENALEGEERERAAFVAALVLL